MFEYPPGDIARISHQQDENDTTPGIGNNHNIINHTSGETSPFLAYDDTNPDEKLTQDGVVGDQDHSQLDSSFHVQNSNWQPDINIVQDRDPEEISGSSGGGSFGFENVESWSGLLYTTGVTGLTQSDSSVNSCGGNPSYCYGNQCEYVGQCEYDWESYLETQTDPEGLQCESTVDNETVGDVDYENLSGSDKMNYTPEESLSLLSPTPSDISTQYIAAIATNVNQNQLEIGMDANKNNGKNCSAVDNPCSVDAENNEQISMVDTYQDAEDNEVFDVEKSCVRPRLTSSLKGRSASESGPKPSKRKSVTFSLDHGDVRPHENAGDSPLEDEVYEENETRNKANEKRDWFGKQRSYSDGSREEKSFLLGPEFEGVEPTYV